MPTSANWTFIVFSAGSMRGRPRRSRTIRGRRLWGAPAKRACGPGQGVGQPGLAGRRRPVGILDFQVDLFAMDRDVARRADAKPYVAPTDIEHDQLDVGADAQPFADASSQNQHGATRGAALRSAASRR